MILSLGDAIPALHGRQRGVIKPSELTPLTVMEIVRAWREDIGAPDVLAVVNGMGETGGALVDESDYMQFTGSERTGKVVMKRAADTLTPVSLELGGKDPMIVTRDADIERAVNATAWGGLLNTGQICISIERVYVEEPIYDEFVDQAPRQGRDPAPGRRRRHATRAEVGAMTSPPRSTSSPSRSRTHAPPARGPHRRQAQGRRRRLVRADRDRRRRPLDEGDARGDLRPGDPGDEGQATSSRRSSSPTTRPTGSARRCSPATPTEGERIARRIEAGPCNVNDVLVNYNVLGLPMGGWKNSGIGVRHGAQGIRRFCHTEALTIPRLPTAKSEPVWFPYSARKRGVVRRLYTFLNARGLRNRLGFAPRQLTEYGGIDGLTRWLGLRWESPRPGPAHRPPGADQPGRAARRAGRLRDGRLLDGLDAVAQRESGERIATIRISINYLRTAREGDVICESVLDRRNDRVAVLRSEVSDEHGRLLATAIGSFSIFPAERLGPHDHGPAAPEAVAE